MPGSSLIRIDQRHTRRRWPRRFKLGGSQREERDEHAGSPGVYGARPSWSTLDPNGNLVSRVSLADYYATLAQWFGVPAAAVLPVPGNVIPGIVS